MTLAFSKILSMFGKFAASKIETVICLTCRSFTPTKLKIDVKIFMKIYNWNFISTNFRKQQIKIESEFN